MDDLQLLKQYIIKQELAWKALNQEFPHAAKAILSMKGLVDLPRPHSYAKLNTLFKELSEQIDERDLKQLREQLPIIKSMIAEACENNHRDVPERLTSSFRRLEEWLIILERS